MPSYPFAGLPEDDDGARWILLWVEDETLGP